MRATIWLLIGVFWGISLLSHAGDKEIRVFIALCDKKTQGVIPVSPKIGNGDDPDSNLYWGCDEGFGSVFRHSKNWQVLEIHADFYDCVTPTQNAIKKPGEWNRYRIACKDDKINVEVNGVMVVDMDLNCWTSAHENPDGTKNKFPKALKDFARVGYLGFQDHGLPVWYRNVRVKKLE